MPVCEYPSKHWPTPCGENENIFYATAYNISRSSAEEELIRKTIGCSRFVYNQTLAARKGAYASGSSIHMTFKESHSGYDCVKLLPGLKDT